MATWLDGPEYAPIERPDEFAVPEVAPLDVVSPPPEPVAAAPAQRPVFSEPSDPVAPLADLVPAVGDERDPSRPFAVVSANLTAAGAWGSVHGTLPHETTALAAPAAPTWPESGWTGSPAHHALHPASPTAPFPTAPAPPLPGAVPPPLPQPGTPEWFAPAPYGAQPSPVRVDVRQVLQAVTYGLLICLLVGTVLGVLAPILLVLAFFLSTQVQAAQTQVRRAFAVGLGFVGFCAVIALAYSPFGFADWWATVGSWARLACLGVAVASVLAVYRELRSRTAPPPPPAYRGPWG